MSAPLPMREGALPPGLLVVAVSGGLDSMVLLHQLRFARSARPLLAAHLDHAMRPGSGRDALWVRGVCRAWDVPLVTERLTIPPAGEAEARERRYRFLERVREQAGGAAVVTAHHADDQAETVLFRVARGTGVRGLRGMETRRGRVVRPLLDCWREVLARYASRWGVPYREDPSNRDLSLARNVVRHQVLPALEAGVARGSRVSLVRLARNAARLQDEMAALDRFLLARFARRDVPGRVELPLEALEGLEEPLVRRLVRGAAEGLGVTLGQAASDRAVAALGTLASGRGLDLQGGLRLERGSTSWILHAPARRAPAGSGDSFLTVPDAGPGEAELALGHARYHITWSPGNAGVGEGIAVEGARHLPLTFRGWRAGDRIRFPWGSKAVTRILGEAGVARLDRPTTPVCADPQGRILWIPGLARAAGVAASGAVAPASGRVHLTCSSTGHA
ncbi:MAG: tRNA lysidine(34) synthetase TilS [Longimicrobiales bacterium]|nr:tRNA lysidine(34) synthetase TilS [Longimicrobiales bacterium]